MADTPPPSLERERLNREKHTTLNRYLEQQWALVHVNTSVPELVVPDHLKAQPTVSLRISRLFAGRLDIKKDHLKAELKFNGDYFTCQIPLEAVWGITSEKSEFAWWPQSTPEQVLSSLSQRPGQNAADPGALDQSTGTVPSPATAANIKTPPEETPPPKQAPTRPVLKRVK
jgi:stringent starvation protein B